MATTRRVFLLLAVVIFGCFYEVNCNYRQKRIVGGTEAPPPPVDDPVVFVVKQDREARVYGSRDPKIGYYLFRGIRYAEPPVGNRRFQRSVPLYLEGDVNATEWAPPCPQPGENGGVIGSEDCLFLNVFTPSLPDATDGYPVLIWIHGGNFRRGAATQYEMRNLVNKKTIVVSIQYRLGSLGFLSNNNKDLSGNNGLFDQILATEWVRDYIEFFGGNPQKIVAFGQGSGASSAFLLGLSKFGKSYFSGIIAMSGSLLSHFAIDKEPGKTTKAIATANNCPTNDTVMMVRCLREVSFTEVIEHDNREESASTKAKNFITDLSTLLAPGPVVEGQNDLRSLPNFVIEEPEDSLSFDNLPEIPLLTGVIKDETGGAVNGPYKDIISNTLKSVPDYLTKTLVPSLQTFVPIFGQSTKQFVPEAFGKYLNVLGNGNGNSNGANKAIESITKVAETLNDAIFNVPAFLTVKKWSNKTKAFLYSFDHQNGHGFGKDFLGGLPLVGDSAETGKASHGDDLGYVFEPNTIHGKAIDKKQVLTEEDEQVMEVFTDMIAQFARSGDLSGGDSKSEDKKPSSLFSFPSFSGGDDGYLSITSKPTIGKQFRFCEMGLWTGIEERYTSALCSLFHVDLKEPFKIVERTITSGLSKVPSLAKVGSVSEYLNVDKFNTSKLIPPIKLPIDPTKVLSNPLAGEKPTLPRPKLPESGKIVPNPLSDKKPELPRLKPTEKLPVRVPGIFG